MENDIDLSSHEKHKTVWVDYNDTNHYGLIGRFTSLKCLTCNQFLLYIDLSKSNRMSSLVKAIYKDMFLKRQGYSQVFAGRHLKRLIEEEKINRETEKEIIGG
jgi:hypothetical protein